jgi:ribosome-binding factor A
LCRKAVKVTNFTASAPQLMLRVLWHKDKTKYMEEGKRQKQIAGVIIEEMNDIFNRMGLNMTDGGMVSISAVKITPDLLEARIYLSLFKVKDQKAALKKIEDRSWEIKKELSGRVKHQLRRIPELKFFLDDTLDHVFKMEELFKQIRPQSPEKE